MAFTTHRLHGWDDQGADEIGFTGRAHVRSMHRQLLDPQPAVADCREVVVRDHVGHLKRHVTWCVPRLCAHWVDGRSWLA